MHGILIGGFTCVGSMHIIRSSSYVDGLENFLELGGDLWGIERCRVEGVAKGSVESSQKNRLLQSWMQLHTNHMHSVSQHCVKI